MASEICLWLKSVVRRFGSAIVFVGLGWMGGATFERWASHQTSNVALAVMMAAIIVAFIVYVRALLWPNDQLTDRRRKRALAANPVSNKSGASKLRRLAAVRWSAWFGIMSTSVSLSSSARSKTTTRWPRRKT
jgi:hypothetical protein